MCSRVTDTITISDFNTLLLPLSQFKNKQKKPNPKTRKRQGGWLINYFLVRREASSTPEAFTCSP